MRAGPWRDAIPGRDTGGGSQNLIRIWVRKYEERAFDDNAHVAD